MGSDIPCEGRSLSGGATCVVWYGGDERSCVGLDLFCCAVLCHRVIGSVGIHVHVHVLVDIIRFLSFILLSLALCKLQLER
jgi:hypothetical protein